MKEIECGGCGHKYSDDYEYCPYCGTKNGQFKLIKYKDAIRDNKSNNKRAAGIIAVVAVILLCLTAVLVIMTSRNPEPAYLQIPETALGKHLQYLNAYEGRVEHYSDSTISITVNNKSNNNGPLIIEEAKKLGFVIDSEESTGSYRAFDDEGCQLVIYDFGDEISVYLDAPVDFLEIAWPQSGMGALLPEPSSMLRHYYSDSNDYFSCYVGNTSKEDMQSYIDMCLNAGFDVDYYRSNDSFSAENENGNSLTVFYHGFNIMEISLYE